MDDRRWIPYLARVFALAGLYFAGAKLGQAFSLTGGRPRIPWTRAGAAEVIALMLTLVLVCGVVVGDWFFPGRYFVPAFVVSLGCDENYIRLEGARPRAAWHALS